ncbi:MAG TPA: copper chaperone PCu(A)C [Caulobacteraceae bacterium]
MKIASITFAAALAIAAPALAHAYKLGALSIGHPWSRPAAAGMNGVGYLTVTNAGKTADVLLKIETPIAERTELHESSMAGGVMRMAPLPKGLPIPAGATVALKPGGAHLMLLKLKQPLKAGDKVPATLVFEKAGRVEVSFAVQAQPPGAGEGHH